MSDEPLRPAEIAEQLGIVVGETIVSEPMDRESQRRSRAAWMTRLVGFVGLFLVLAAPAVGDTDSDALNAVALVLGIALLLAAAKRIRTSTAPWEEHGDPIVEADAFGLRLTCRYQDYARRFDWPAIEDLRPVYGHVGPDNLRAVERWIVSVEGGDSFHFLAAAPNAERILCAIRYVLEARRQGRPLWDPAILSAGAISRMSGEDRESAERGISRIDPPGGT